MTAEEFLHELRRRVLDDHKLAVPQGDELLLIAAVQFEMLKLAQQSVHEAQLEALEQIISAATEGAEAILRRARAAAERDRQDVAQAAAATIAQDLETSTARLERATRLHHRVVSRTTLTCAGFALIALVSGLAPLVLP